MDPEVNEAQRFENYYFMFTNSGYARDDESLTGVSPEPMKINDLLVLPDMTRFGWAS